MPAIPSLHERVMNDQPPLPFGTLWKDWLRALTLLRLAHEHLDATGNPDDGSAADSCAETIRELNRRFNLSSRIRLHCQHHGKPAPDSLLDLDELLSRPSQPRAAPPYAPAEGYEPSTRNQKLRKALACLNPYSMYAAGMANPPDANPAFESHKLTVKYVREARGFVGQKSTDIGVVSQASWTDTPKFVRPATREGHSVMPGRHPDTGNRYYEENISAEHRQSPLYIFHSRAWAKRVYARILEQTHLPLCPFFPVETTKTLRWQNPDDGSGLAYLLEAENELYRIAGMVVQGYKSVTGRKPEFDPNNTKIISGNNRQKPGVVLPYYKPLDRDMLAYSDEEIVRAMAGKKIILELRKAHKDAESGYEDKNADCTRPDWFERMIEEEKQRIGLPRNKPIERCPYYADTPTQPSRQAPSPYVPTRATDEVSHLMSHSQATDDVTTADIMRFLEETAEPS